MRVAAVRQLSDARCWRLTSSFAAVAAVCFSQCRGCSSSTTSTNTELIAFVHRTLANVARVTPHRSTLRPVTVPELATRLMDDDEDKFERIMSTSGGQGLLGFLRQFPQSFALSHDASSGGSGNKAWRVRLIERPISAAAVSPPKTVVQLQSPKEKSATAMYWESFDPAPLLKFIPDTWAPWDIIQTVVPQDWLAQIPREQRKKNLARVLAPHCDIALQYARHDFVVRRKAANDAASAPSDSMDAAAAITLLQEKLPDEGPIIEVIQSLFAMTGYSGVDMAHIPTLLPASVFDSVVELVDESVQWRKIFKAYPTVASIAIRGGNPLLFPLAVDPIDPATATEQQRRQLELAKILAMDIREVIDKSGRLKDDSVPGLSLDGLLALVGESISLERLLQAGDIGFILLHFPDVLPLDEAGLVDTRIGVPYQGCDSLLDDEASEESKAKSKPAAFRSKHLWHRRRAAMKSCCGVRPSLLYTPASDEELEDYCAIVRTRWSNQIRTMQRRQKMLLVKKNGAATEELPSVYAKSQRAIAVHIHSILPKQQPVVSADGVTRFENPFVELHRAIEKMDTEAKIQMRKSSILMFAQQYPDLFELAETFEKRSANYFIRARDPGERADGSGISAGQYTDEEMHAFIAACMPAAPGAFTTVSNVWSKLPLSLRLQLKYPRAFEEFVDVKLKDSIVLDRRGGTMTFASSSQQQEPVTHQAS